MSLAALRKIIGADGALVVLAAAAPPPTDCKTVAVPETLGTGTALAVKGSAGGGGAKCGATIVYHNRRKTTEMIMAVRKFFSCIRSPEKKSDPILRDSRDGISKGERSCATRRRKIRKRRRLPARTPSSWAQNGSAPACCRPAPDKNGSCRWRQKRGFSRRCGAETSFFP